MGASKFTPDARAVIVASIQTGGSLAAACRQLDIRLKTAEVWLTRGRREGEGPYAEFVAAVEDARESHKRAGLDRDDFDKYLAKAVRAGSVQAMKLWWNIHGKPEEPDADADPLDFADDDELAQRRSLAS